MYGYHCWCAFPLFGKSYVVFHSSRFSPEIFEVSYLMHVVLTSPVVSVSFT